MPQVPHHTHLTPQERVRITTEIMNMLMNKRARKARQWKYTVGIPYDSPYPPVIKNCKDFSHKLINLAIKVPSKLIYI